MGDTDEGYPVPDDETERLQALHRYDILDSAPEDAYDELVEIAAEICDAPVALVSLVDDDRQWFKAHRGVDVDETGRDISFCARTIMDAEEVMVVEDATEDPRFEDNPQVTGEPGYRFYAGAPIVTDDGHPLGTICVLDTVPRRLSEDQRLALEALSRHVRSLLELRRSGQQLRESRRELETFARYTSEEIRDPLTGVLGNLELAAMHLDEGRAHRLVDQARSDGEDLLDRIDLLAEYTRSDGARGLEPVDLDEIVDQVLDGLADRIEDSQAEIVVEDLPVAKVSPDQVRALMTNLIGNALRYHEDEPPRVTIEAELVDGRCHVTVSDQGLDIPAAAAETFFELEDAQNGLRRGAGAYGGLDLVLCERIVERHGGRIAVEADSSPGAAFNFSLPAP